MTDIYLISAATEEKSELIAKYLRLTNDQFIHIPYDSELKKRKIRNRQVNHKKYLIGYFTKEERQSLLN